MKCVFLFESVHRVMKAEKLLKGKGIKIDLIPVPREISSDCGVAIELSGDLEAEALLVLKENRISVVECYTRDLKGRFEKRKQIQA
jgi:Putative Se/S carrier protein-like